MKVKELIEHLKTFDRNAAVKAYDPESSCYEIITGFVFGDGVIELHTDIDEDEK